MKVLKVAHENLLGSGGEIPHIGRYGGLIWQYFGFLEFGCTSRAHTQYRRRLAKGLRATIKRTATVIIMLAT